MPPRPRSRTLVCTSSQPSSSASSSAKSAIAAAARLLDWPDADKSSSMRTLRILSGAGMMVNWSGSGGLMLVCILDKDGMGILSREAT